MTLKDVIRLASLAFATTVAALGQTNGVKLWEFTASPRLVRDPDTGATNQLPANIFSSPAIGADGTIYFGSGAGKFYALTPSGTEKWSFQTGAEIQSSPAIAADGTIYFGSADGKLYALNANGTKEWEFSTDYMILSSPAIGSDGTIYIGSRDSRVYAVNPDGTRKWSLATGRNVDSSPVIGSDGTIYVGSFDGNLYALNPDGSEKWRFGYSAANPAGGLGAGIAIGLDGTLYVTGGDDPMKVFALRPDGTKIWQLTFGPAMALTYASAPTIGPDGTLYVAGNDRKIYAIDPDGTQKWEAFTGAYSQSSIALGKDGLLYLMGDLTLFAFDDTGTRKWVFETDRFGAAGGITAVPTLTHNAVIYVGSGNGHFYAMKASGGLAESAWPIFRRDGLQRARAVNAVVRRPNSLVIATDEASLNITGAFDPDRGCRMESSPDLQTWTTVTNFANPSGQSSFVEALSPGNRQLFYRLVVP